MFIFAGLENTITLFILAFKRNHRKTYEQLMNVIFEIQNNLNEVY